MECEEFGWYSKLVPEVGWVSCDSTDPDGSHDLNRLYTDAQWSPTLGRFILK